VTERTETGTGLGVLDAAIFVCYEPLSDVLERITLVAGRVANVVVVDDGSRTIATDFYLPLQNLANVSVVSKPVNLGIAHSINIGFARSVTAGARTILTFDQDTTIDNELLDALSRAVAEVPDGWGALGPGVVSGFGYSGSRTGEIRQVFELIQSAAVFNSKALAECGFADESLVIDSVDTDLCLRLRAGGFGVYADERVALNQPIGDGHTISVFGRKLSSTNHSVVRRYYMTRNRLEMFRRYGRQERRWLVTALFWFAVSIVLSLTVADHRLATLRATGRGIWDFAHRRSGQITGAMPAAGIVDGVAVVMVTKDGTRHLLEQLKSIVEQSVPPDRLFLVDDHSADGSKQLVLDYFADHSDIPVTVVDPPTRVSWDLFTRIAGNFSAGLRAAAGYRLIALADQDDVWELDRLAWQRKRLEQSGALLTAGNGKLINGDGIETGGTLRDRFPVLPGWETADGSARLRSVLKESMATGAATMIDSRILSYGLPIPHGWLHDRWLSIVAVARDGLDVDERTVVRYRVYPEQVVGLTGRAGLSGWKRVMDAGRKPALTVRKVRHLSLRLRRVVVDDVIRAELSTGAVVRAYLSKATHRTNDLG
jgi:GT2 family glycosyltransferase